MYGVNDVSALVGTFGIMETWVSSLLCIAHGTVDEDHQGRVLVAGGWRETPPSLPALL